MTIKRVNTWRKYWRVLTHTQIPFIVRTRLSFYSEGNSKALRFTMHGDKRRFPFAADPSQMPMSVARIQQQANRMQDHPAHP